MSNPIERFSNKVENYIKYRPGYPRQIISLLQSECGLTENSIIADVGSGTGILTELFLKNGNTVFGVEPNQWMRAAAERLLQDYPKFVSRNGSAECTNLQSGSVDFVTAAQSFHWFDHRSARAEFSRIAKPGGWVVLIWNERRVDSTAFLNACEELLLRYGTDYSQVRHENVTTQIGDFFSPERFKLSSFENVQEFDFDGLKGRILSASYTPEATAANFEPLMANLKAIFETHAKRGLVRFEYDTKIYYGHLTPAG